MRNKGLDPKYLEYVKVSVYTVSPILLLPGILMLPHQQWMDLQGRLTYRACQLGSKAQKARHLIRTMNLNRTRNTLWLFKNLINITIELHVRLEFVLVVLVARKMTDQVD